MCGPRPGDSQEETDPGPRHEQLPGPETEHSDPSVSLRSDTTGHTATRAKTQTLTLPGVLLILLYVMTEMHAFSNCLISWIGSRSLFVVLMVVEILFPAV